MRIAMRPRNALGYRRHPFRQHGDIDHARRAGFPSLPQQLARDFGPGQNGNSALRWAVVQTRRYGGARDKARGYPA